MNHTPTPWNTAEPIHEYKSGSVWVSTVFAENGPEWGKIAAEATAPDREMARANAEFIVKACNAHKDLVTALKSILDTQTMPTAVHAMDECYRIAKEAIAKAEGL